MAKFKFKFEALKKLRKNKLDVARKHMIIYQEKLQKAVEAHRQAIHDRYESIPQLKEGISDTSSTLLVSAYLIQSGSAKISQLVTEIQQLEQEFERHRNWVTSLGKELKILEKLEEKQIEAARLEENEKEKKIADAWLVERWKPGQMVKG